MKRRYNASFVCHDCSILGLVELTVETASLSCGTVLRSQEIDMSFPGHDEHHVTFIVTNEIKYHAEEELQQQRE